jgi:hypothetical protein
LSSVDDELIQDVFGGSARISAVLAYAWIYELRRTIIGVSEGYIWFAHNADRPALQSLLIRMALSETAATTVEPLCPWQGVQTILWSTIAASNSTSSDGAGVGPVQKTTLLASFLLPEDKGGPSRSAWGIAAVVIVGFLIMASSARRLAWRLSTNPVMTSQASSSRVSGLQRSEAEVLIKKHISDQLSDSSLISIEIDPGMTSVYIKYRAHDNLTNNMIRQGILYDTFFLANSILINV